MKIAYVGNFSQRHCTEVHISKTLQNMGHQVVEIQEDPSNAASLMDKVKQCDLFLFTRTWNNLVTLEHLAQMRQLGIPSASYHLDLYIGLQRESGLRDDPFWKTDYVFSPDGNPKSQKVFESYGINHYYMKPGVFKDECMILPPQKIRPQVLGNDVIFVGGGSAYMHKEWPYRRALVMWLQQTYKNRYSKYGHPERVVRNLELNQLYANSKVVVGDSLSLNFDHPHYWSDRVYETIGRGGFIIHPYIKGMEEEFTDGENIVFYEFNNWKQLKEKIDYYLHPDNQKERLQIMLNGQKLVKEKCTYNNRLEQMLSILNIGGNKVAIAQGDTISTEQPLRINLGAGTDIQEGYVNVDMMELEGIDVVHNLIKFPWPFDDESAFNIRAIDILEHLPPYIGDRSGVIQFIEECHRILKPGGELFIQTPGWRAEFLWIDPTHVRGFDIQSMDFFDPEKPFGKSTGFYSDCKFSVSSVELPNHNIQFTMRKI